MTPAPAAPAYSLDDILAWLRELHSQTQDTQTPVAAALAPSEDTVTPPTSLAPAQEGAGCAAETQMGFGWWVTLSDTSTRKAG